jgi:hypothetical protein
MPRRQPEDDDDDRPRRRRRPKPPPDRTLLIAGVALGVSALVVAVVAGVFYVRGRPKVEETTNEYGETVTTTKVAIEGGSMSETRTRLPADDTPRGVRWAGDQRKADPAVVTEAWKHLAGRWERPGPGGETLVVEFRPDYTVTLTVPREDLVVRTGHYKLASVTDESRRFAWDKSGNRRYSLKLKEGQDRDRSLSYDCVVLPDGSLADAGNTSQPYRRVR